MGKASRRKHTDAQQLDAAARIAARVERDRIWHEQRASADDVSLEERLHHLIAAALVENRAALEVIERVHDTLTRRGWVLNEVLWANIEWDGPAHPDDVDEIENVHGTDLGEIQASVSVDVLFELPLYYLQLPERDSTIGETSMYFADPDRLLEAAEVASSLRPGAPTASIWEAFPDALSSADVNTFNRGIQIALP